MAQAVGAAEPGSMIKSYDFVGDGSTPTRNWLEQRLFQLKHHFRHDNKIALSQPGDALHIQVKENAFGIIVHEEDIPNARLVRLEWGVSSFPDGASYEHGVDVVPPVSGISIEVDTTHADNDGRAAAFISSHSFFH